MTEPLIIDSKGFSFLSQFLDDLPDNVYLSKVLTGCGNTTLAILNDVNYVIAVPFISLIVNKYHSHKNICPVYGDIFDSEIEDYIKNPDIEVKKFMVTYDSLARLLKFIDPQDYKILIDEAHKLLDSASFRTNAVETVLENYTKFKSFVFATATPVRDKYQLPALRDIPKAVIKWYDTQPVDICHYKYEKDLNQVIAVLVIKFLKEELEGNPYFFINSVKSIINILRYLKKAGYDNPLNYRVICADNNQNRNSLNNAGLNDYEILDTTSENRKITFITSTGFEGSDYFDEDGVTYIITDGSKDHTKYDILTQVVQIIGRLRDSKYKNSINILYTPNTYFSYTTIEEFEVEVKSQLEKYKKVVESFNSTDSEEVRNILISGSRTVPYLLERPGELRLNENAWYCEMNNYEIVNSQFYTKPLENKLINGIPYNFKRCSPDITLEGLNKLRLAKKPNFKKLCLEYIQAKKDNNLEVIEEIEISFPLIEEAYKKLGVEKMKALEYRANNFTAALVNLKITLSMESRIVTILDLKVGQLVDKPEIKKSLQNIYSLLGINKVATATDLAQWYTIKDHDKRVDGKCRTMLKIINCNVK